MKTLPTTAHAADMEVLKTEVNQLFKDLTEEQLNWKPQPKQWSIAQCFQHLIVTDEHYFAQFDKIIAGKKNDNFWFSIPILPHLLGRTLAKIIKPETSMKYISPPAFNPTKRSLPASIVSSFEQHLEQMRSYYLQLTPNKTQEQKIYSPAARLVVFKFDEAALLISNHIKRHVNQAKKVLAHPQFPN